MSSPSVSTIILEQLGMSRFIAMTGAKNFLYTDDSLQFDIPARNKSKANKVRITLDYGKDLYKIEYFKYNRSTLDLKKLHTYTDVFVSELRSNFESVTGFRCTL